MLFTEKLKVFSLLPENFNAAKVKSSLKQSLSWVIELFKDFGQWLSESLAQGAKKIGHKLFKVAPPPTAAPIDHGIVQEIFGENEPAAHDVISHIYSFLSPEDQLRLGQVSKRTRDAGYRISQTFFKEAQLKRALPPEYSSSEGWEKYCRESKANVKSFLSYQKSLLGAENLSAYLDKIPFIPCDESEEWQRQWFAKDKCPPFTVIRSYRRSEDVDRFFPQLVLFYLSDELHKTSRSQSRYRFSYYQKPAVNAISLTRDPGYVCQEFFRVRMSPLHASCVYSTKSVPNESLDRWLEKSFQVEIRKSQDLQRQRKELMSFTLPKRLFKKLDLMRHLLDQIFNRFIGVSDV
ncbi:MAG: hypothetical protein K0S07_1302 [Chlamydiales bacterium]|jgi:hypothetical protein|nr:hypothetical protein [Chlamydiales bacterium]